MSNTRPKEENSMYARTPRIRMFGMALLGVLAGFQAGSQIEISSIEELQEIGNHPEYPLDGDYVLVEDIDASDTAGWNDGAGFEPIDEFSGAFDGVEHTVSSLVVAEGVYGSGLFGVTTADAEITNVQLDHADISGGEAVGGLVGWNRGMVSDSHVTGTVSGAEEVGGLVGSNSGAILKSYATASVEGAESVGGLAGWNRDEGSVSQSFATGAVKASSAQAGGLLGSNRSIVSDSYATGAVEGGRRVGGLAGYNRGTISDTYATGRVRGRSRLGGLVGANDRMGYRGGGTIETSFWDTQSSGQRTSDGGAGLSTEAMMQQTTFTEAGWDFEETWRVTEGVGYPHLQAILHDALLIAPAGPLDSSGPPEGPFLPKKKEYTLTNGSEARLEWEAVTKEDWVAASPGSGVLAGGESVEVEVSLTSAVQDLDLEAGKEYEDAIAFHNVTSGGFRTRDVSLVLRSPIFDIEELQKIGNHPDYPLDGDYALMDDIDASDTAEWNDGAGFEPIGEYDYSQPSLAFTGTFDGQGHVITGLVINRPEDDRVGLFSVLREEALIENLGLEGGAVDGGSRLVGGLAGANFGGMVSNSYTALDVTGTGGYVGGLVGRNNERISQSHAMGAVKGGRRVGGLAGYSGGLISDSHATGDVTGRRDVGGLVGFSYGPVSQSYATGDVEGKGILVGGLVGDINDEMSACYATGNVTGESVVGGLAGLIHGPVSKSYATGDVTGTSTIGGLAGINAREGMVSETYAAGAVEGLRHVGGLIGFNNSDGELAKSYAKGPVDGVEIVGGLVGANRGALSESYATGAVTGEEEVGGLVGKRSDEYWAGTVENSFWDLETSGQDESDGGVGLSTREMRSKNTFTEAGWDFDDVWRMAPEGSYPLLSAVDACEE